MVLKVSIILTFNIKANTVNDHLQYSTNALRRRKGFQNHEGKNSYNDKVIGYLKVFRCL